MPNNTEHGNNNISIIRIIGNNNILIGKCINNIIKNIILIQLETFNSCSSGLFI